MSPTSYQTAPPRGFIIAMAVRSVNFVGRCFVVVKE
jgi:hypothetical protein